MDGYANDRHRDRGARSQACDAGKPVHRRRRYRRYIRRHGTDQVTKAALVSAMPPLVLKTVANPEGTPLEVLNGLRASLAKDRSQFCKESAIQFYGANRPGAEVLQGVLDQFWLWSMQSGLKNACESIKAFSETDSAPTRRPSSGASHDRHPRRGRSVRASRGQRPADPGICD